MRNLILTAVGAVALASGSMAAAASFISNPVNMSLPTVSMNANDITIAFSQNPLPASFSGGFDINNAANGIYSIQIGTSTPGVTFTGGTLTNLGTSAFTNFVLGSTICCGANSSLGIAPTFFAAGNYRLAFNGLSTLATGADAGTVTISPGGVPEPATWAMMLLGFGGIGVAMRRRRRPVLAQIA